MVERVPSGIKGLDDLVEGGIPKGSITLVTGPSGAGKSLLSLSFLGSACRNGERTLYVTIEEPGTSLVEGARGIGLPIEEWIDNGKMSISDLTTARMLTDSRKDSSSHLADFKTVTSIVKNEVERGGLSRVVVDSLTAIGIYYPDESDFRQELFRFCQEMRMTGVTAFLVGESRDGGAATRHGIEQFLADGFIFIDLEKIEGELRRTLTVRKMRFTKNESSTHPLLILREGIRVSTREKVY